MSPTRELCLQIGKECKRFAKPLNLRVVTVYGGTGISEQIAELKRGAEIIVCTPGRMIDMLAANNGKNPYSYYAQNVNFKLNILFRPSHEFKTRHLHRPG